MLRVILYILGIKLPIDSSKVHSMEVKQDDSRESPWSLSRDTRIENNTFVRPLKVQKIKRKLDYRKLKIF